jgi:hypothetical protein
MYAYEAAEAQQPVRLRAVHGRDGRRTDFDCLLFPVTGCVADRRTAAGFTTTRLATRSSAKPAAARPNARAAGYYVEFRTARIGLYWHSYAAFGKLEARGNPASAEYADLHPMGKPAMLRPPGLPMQSFATRTWRKRSKHRKAFAPTTAATISVIRNGRAMRTSTCAGV